MRRTSSSTASTPERDRRAANASRLFIGRARHPPAPDASADEASADATGCRLTRPAACRQGAGQTRCCGLDVVVVAVVCAVARAVAGDGRRCLRGAVGPAGRRARRRGHGPRGRGRGRRGRGRRRRGRGGAGRRRRGARRARALGRHGDGVRHREISASRPMTRPPSACERSMVFPFLGPAPPGCGQVGGGGGCRGRHRLRQPGPAAGERRARGGKGFGNRSVSARRRVGGWPLAFLVTRGNLPACRSYAK